MFCYGRSILARGPDVCDGKPQWKLHRVSQALTRVRCKPVASVSALEMRHISDRKLLDIVIRYHQYNHLNISGLQCYTRDFTKTEHNLRLISVDEYDITGYVM